MPMTDLLDLAFSSPKAATTTTTTTSSSSESTPLLASTSKELADDVDRDVVQFEDFGQGMLDEIAQSAEHVRMWYYPQSDQVMIARANRTYEVSCPCILLRSCQQSSQLHA
jgi:hypothetical protein